MSTQPQNTRGLSDMPLMDPATLQCPYHYDKTLREQAPVYRDPQTGVYIVSTYDLVREAHRTPDVFSNEFGLAVGSSQGVDPDVKAAMDQTYNLGKGTLLTVDDPEHKIYRDAVKDFFTASYMEKYEPWIRERSHSLVDTLAEKGECKFIEEFARPLPLSVIMHVLGIPADMYDLAFKWTVDNVIALSQMADKDALLAAQRGLKDEYDWFVSALDERRGKPAEDLLGVIANLKYEDRDLTIEEQLSYCTQFLVAGNETTTATLAENMRQLCLFPDQLEKVRADRSLIPNMVDESLRLASPTSNMWRVTKSDYELGGVSIPAGSMVLLKYFSSDHDESMFEEPLAFDVTRENAKRHIAFGFGTHVCIGQHLSKLEMRVAWEVLLDRFDHFELACEPGELEYMPNILLRGLEEIPIRYRVAS
jgi:cytochrome P450 family 142 subfamily A polypeptide 1